MILLVFNIPATQYFWQSGYEWFKPREEYSSKVRIKVKYGFQLLNSYK